MAAIPRLLYVLLLIAWFCPCVTDRNVRAEDVREVSRATHASPVSEASQDVVLNAKDEARQLLQATTINPYRYADIGSEVEGIVEAFSFDEGDYLPKGTTIVEISKKRYRLLAERARDAVQGMELAFERAERHLTLIRKLLSQDASTRQELLQAQADKEIAQTNLKKARKEADLADLNLAACRLKAPFDGYLAVRYKQPYEPVQRLEKVFSIVDSAQVYAVANVAANLLDRFEKDSQAVFIDSSGKDFTGTVDKIGKIIDAKSNTRKVYVLIDNASGDLEVGMTGFLKPKQPGSP